MKETSHQTSARRPRVVAVGGLDPSGGAGLIRDFLTGESLGAQVLLVGTAWTLQSPAGVAAVEPRAPDHLQHALATTLHTAGAGGDRVAVKIGMVASEAQVAALLAALDRFAGAVVFDPVLAASSGGRLFEGEAEALLPLLRRATLVTPNLAEAAALAGQAVQDATGARAAARALVDLGAPAVLVKGGHLADRADDLLVCRAAGGTTAGSAAGARSDASSEGGVADRVEQVFPGARVPGASPRGTGCALATAIAVELAAGRPLAEAVLAAKTWLRDRIASARPVGGERHL